MKQYSERQERLATYVAGARSAWDKDGWIRLPMQTKSATILSLVQRKVLEYRPRMPMLFLSERYHDGLVRLAPGVTVRIPPAKFEVIFNDGINAREKETWAGKEGGAATATATEDANL